MILLRYILLLHSFCFAWAARLVRHDEHFTPDIILRVTAKSIPIACTTRFIVVINGTTPGPLIVLREGKVAWIRVYNDISGQNLTMVGCPVNEILATLTNYEDYSIGMD
jgi:hypothetical protein